MKTKLILALLVLGSSVSANAQVFGRNADAGAVVGGIVGAVIGHNNGQKVWQGAAIGAGVGLVAGAIADNNQQRVYTNQHTYQDTYVYHNDRDFYPTYGQVVVSSPHTRVVVVQAPPPPPRVVVVHQPSYVYTYTYTSGHSRYTTVRNSQPCPSTYNNHYRSSNHNVYTGHRDYDRRDHNRRR